MSRLVRHWLLTLRALGPIRRLGLFRRDWYRTRRPGLPYWGRLLPLCHYLIEGGYTGRRPSPAFDSGWYLDQYPDVGASGLNPLVHYVLYGRPEGRSPYLGAAIYLSAEPAALDQRERWYFRLWGGFEHLVVPELREAATCGSDTARWLLAEWDYANGDTSTAFERLQQLIGPEGPCSERECHAWEKCTGVPVNEAGRRRLEWAAQARALFKDEAVFPAQCGPSPTPGGGPLVSVIVPAYNAGRYLGRALTGLVAQSWPQLEILVVDDASEDDTAEVVRRWARADERIRLLRNERNLGAYPTRNRGMREARGEFITVHDADDWSFPEKIERQLAPLRDEPELVATGSVWMRVSERGQPVGSWMLGESFIEPNHSAWLIRRTALERVGLWDEVKVAADTEFLWRLEHHYGRQALRTVSPDRPLSLALSDDATLTRAKATHVRSVFYGLRRLYREAAGWWHRATEWHPVMREVRPFPAPLGNLVEPSRSYDRVVAANLAQPAQRLLEWLEQAGQAGERLCLLHWPDYLGWQGNPVADAVFELAHRYQWPLGHADTRVEAPQVVLADTALWRYPPTRTLAVHGLQGVIGLDGGMVDDESALMAYFREGGVQWR